MSYASCQWKVNVVLSTNYLAKVLRPEIHMELCTHEGKRVRMTISIERFEELRRQMAMLLRQ